MSTTAGDRLQAGHDALDAGDWLAARDAFRAALEESESPEALYGLSEALWWLGETQNSVECRERAYVGFRRQRNPARAAEMALALCVHYRANVGNRPAAAGWLARAQRLVEDAALEELRGWVLPMEAGEADDPHRRRAPRPRDARAGVTRQ